MPDKEPTPSDRAPNQSAPFVMPSPFAAPDAPTLRQRAGGATVWTVLGIVLGTALATAVQSFLTSHGVPAPVVDQAAREIQNVLPSQR